MNVRKPEMLAPGTPGRPGGPESFSFGDRIVSVCCLRRFHEERILVVTTLIGAVNAGMQLQMIAMLTSQILE